MAEQKQDDQLEHTFSSYVRIRNIALKTYQRRWTIGRSGERGSEISVLVARHDDYNSRHQAFSTSQIIQEEIQRIQYYIRSIQLVKITTQSLWFLICSAVFIFVALMEVFLSNTNKFLGDQDGIIVGYGLTWFSFFV